MTLTILSAVGKAGAFGRTNCLKALIGEATKAGRSGVPTGETTADPETEAGETRGEKRRGDGSGDVDS